MTSPAEEAVTKARLRGYVAVWLLAVERQRDRLLALSSRPPTAPGEDNRAAVEAELVLFAVALRNLIRAVEWAAELGASGVDGALAEFDQEVPNAVDIRDLLEHFDDYEQGHGKLQGRKPKPRPRRISAPTIDEYVYYFVHTGETVQLQFTSGLVLDVVAAGDAARQLGYVTLDALS